jgi:ribosomal RNA assembly protein
MRYVRIPQERIGVVIGPGGSTKEQLERMTGVRTRVDSEAGEVWIDDKDPKDPLMPLKVEDIVRAIARGFSPDHAFKLINEDFYLHVFDVHDYVGKEREDVRRVAARVIGSEGKTRRIIEELSGALVSVYGHTVSIIGDLESMEIGKRAVDMILSGSEHAAVYRFLEGQRRKSKLASREW